MLEIMHELLNNFDIIGQNVGQIQQTSGTKSETTGTIVPVVNMLKYALNNLLHYILFCNYTCFTVLLLVGLHLETTINHHLSRADWKFL